MRLFSSYVMKAGLSGAWHYLGWVAAFSFGINLLTLAVPIYSMQLFDRVLQSGSGATLLVLTVAVVAALVTSSALEDVRARLLVALGVRFDSALSAKLFEHQLEADASEPRNGQAIRDLDNVRQTLTGNGTLAIFDLAWSPIFVMAMFYLHPVLGAITLGGMVFVVGLAVLNQVVVGGPLKVSTRKSEESYLLTDGALHNTETVRALGMLPDVTRRWEALRARAIDSQADASGVNASVAGIIRFLRYALQVGIMASGAWLCVTHEISAGTLYASSLISARALTPVDQIVAVWRQLAHAFLALERVDAVFDRALPQRSMPLPEPEGRLAVEGLTYSIGNAKKPTLSNVNFAIEPGDALGIVGSSAAGKSTLAKLIVGVTRPTSGAIRLDGAETWAWNRADFGRHVGYVSQNIELFEGTIAENIARFRNVDSLQIVEAARLAGVHDMILALPKGYETPLARSGAPLSGGQRQRIAIARAVFGAPKLVVFDEPNSNLDGEGENALQALLSTLKARRTTVIMIAHRPAVLANLDKVLILKDGTVADFGPVETIMPRIAPGFPLARRRIGGVA